MAQLHYIIPGVDANCLKTPYSSDSTLYAIIDDSDDVVLFDACDSDDPRNITRTCGNATLAYRIWSSGQESLVSVTEFRTAMEKLTKVKKNKR